MKNLRFGFQKLIHFIGEIPCFPSSNPRFLLYFLTSVIFLTSSLAYAAQVRLAWDKNSEPDIMGYKMHYGTISGNYQNTVDIKNFTTCTISGLNACVRYYFAVTAYDTQQNESGFSNEDSYRVPDNPPPPPHGDPLSLEIGQLQINDKWKHVNFKNTYTDPIVIASALKLNGGQPAAIRIRGVNKSGFDIRIQEWPYQDGPHTNEVVGYLVMERGHHQLGDGTRIEAIHYIAWEPSIGKIQNFDFDVDTTGDVVRDRFHTIFFDQSLNKNPFFLADMQTADGLNTANVRWRNKSVSSVQVQIDEEQSFDSETAHKSENVGYITVSSAN